MQRSKDFFREAIVQRPFGTDDRGNVIESGKLSMLGDPHRAEEIQRQFGAVGFRGTVGEFTVEEIGGAAPQSAWDAFANTSPDKYNRIGDGVVITEMSLITAWASESVAPIRGVHAEVLKSNNRDMLRIDALRQQ